MRLWVTRTAPDAEATAERLRAVGHEPLVAPVLAVEPGATELRLDGVAALAFTSRNAVAAFPPGLIAHAPKVFTVGAATAEAASAAGFGEVLSADGDGLALAELIAAHAGALEGEVLHLGPEEPAFDLVGALSAKGVPARHLPLYRTRTLPMTDEVRAALNGAAAPLDGLVVHSPKGARQAAELLVSQPRRGELTAFAISETAAAPLRSLGLGAVHAAAAPNEEALLALIEHGPARPLLSPLFWALLGFGLLCVLGGAAVALLGPRL
ncbi:MAG TPA: uroporphyrinogen-III synthase [Caulobacteraceae bacterium]|jgi:uroporphyrinogen-III synthase